MITLSPKTLSVYSDFCLGTAVIKRVSVVRHLGVMLVDKLNFHNHVRVIPLSYFRVSGIVTRLNLVFRNILFLCLVQNLILPKQDFASVIRNN